MTAISAVQALESAPTVVRQFVDFLETGRAAEGLFTDDVFCDFSMPLWRLQVGGPDGVVAARTAGHPGPSTVTKVRLDSTPSGFVLEYAEEWDWAGEHWYARQMVRADVRGTAISELNVYCTGDWDAATVASHAEEVTLLRP